ncbi:hypothetical protein GN244_ATG04431 [Phytophthora infestans]|uniref:Uncharacterized protein n=1 Tax=Phytophthora infestans TaxID=4787 RepID=A0A833T4E3_PHYIN|nr:hypothetical protein GN244_ATG04431 [Phytophthora infestans]
MAALEASAGVAEKAFGGMEGEIRWMLGVKRGRHRYWATEASKPWIANEIIVEIPKFGTRILDFSEKKKDEIKKKREQCRWMRRA